MKNKYKSRLAIALAITTMMLLGVSSFGATLEAVDAAWIQPNRGARDSGVTLQIENNKRTYLRFPVSAGSIGGVAAADISNVQLGVQVLQHEAAHKIDIYVLNDESDGTAGPGYETESSWTGGTDGTEVGGNNVGSSSAPDGGMFGTPSDGIPNPFNTPVSNALCTLVGSFTYSSLDGDNSRAGDIVLIPITRLADFKTALAEDTNGEITLLTECDSGIETQIAGLFNTNDYVVPTLLIEEEGVTDSTAPDALTDLIVTSERDYVDLSWSTNYFVDFDSYEIYRSETSGSYDYNSPVASVENINNTAFTDTNIIYDTTYYYEVRVTDLAGNESASSPEANALPFLDEDPPPTPSNLVIQGWVESVTISWDELRDFGDPENDLAGYNIYRSTTPGEYPENPIWTNNYWSRFTDDSPDLIVSNTYYYTITSMDDSISSNESPKSVEVSAMPISLAMPPNLPLRLSPPDPLQESWTTTADSIIYVNDDPSGIADDGIDGGTRNGTALRKIEGVDKTTGALVEFEGTLELLDGYGDDNNRVGIYLFGDADDLIGDIGGRDGDEEPGALYCHVNTDPGNGNLRIVEGLDGERLVEQPVVGLIGDALYGTGEDLHFSVTAEWIGTETNDVIKVDIIFTDPTGIETSTNTVVPATSYRGDYYGFATRGRNRGRTSSNRDAPFTVEYKDLTFTQLRAGDGIFDAYEVWSNDRDVKQFSEDDDGDGVSNIKEYAFGGNPKRKDDTGVLPVLSLSPEGGYTYVFTKRADAQGISYKFETSTNLLTGWSSTDVTAVGTGGVDDFVFVTNEVDNVENQFIRVNVERVPVEE